MKKVFAVKVFPDSKLLLLHLLPSNNDVLYFVYDIQCFPQVENLLVVVGGVACDSSACDGAAFDSIVCVRN